MTGQSHESGNNSANYQIVPGQPPFESVTHHGDKSERFVGRIFYLDRDEELKGVVELHAEANHYAISFETDQSPAKVGRTLLDILPDEKDMIIDLRYEDGRSEVSDSPSPELFSDDRGIASFKLLSDDLELTSTQGGMVFTARHNDTLFLESIFEASAKANIKAGQDNIINELAEAQAKLAALKVERAAKLQQLATGLGAIAGRIDNSALYHVGVRKFKTLSSEEVGSDVKEPELPEYEPPRSTISEDGQSVGIEFTLAAPGVYDPKAQLTREQIIDLKKSFIAQQRTSSPNGQFSLEAIDALAQKGVDLTDPSWRFDWSEDPVIAEQVRLYRDPRVQYLMFRAAGYALVWSDGLAETALRLPGGLWPKHMTPPATFADALARSSQFDFDKIENEDSDEFWLGNGTLLQQALLKGDKAAEIALDRWDGAVRFFNRHDTKVYSGGLAVAALAAGVILKRK